jgi:hypothetical protein
MENIGARFQKETPDNKFLREIAVWTLISYPFHVKRGILSVISDYIAAE